MKFNTVMLAFSLFTVGCATTPPVPKSAILPDDLREAFASFRSRTTESNGKVVGTLTVKLFTRLTFGLPRGGEIPTYFAGCRYLIDKSKFIELAGQPDAVTREGHLEYSLGEGNKIRFYFSHDELSDCIAFWKQRA